VTAAFAVIACALILYAWQVEPFWIEVSHHRIVAGLKSPIRLMVLCDLHTRGFGRLEKRVLEDINSEHPDLIVVIGDCFTPGADHTAAHQLLSQLKAPLGVWLVRGNWENWNPVADEPAFYGSAGVRLLVNSNGAPRADLSIVGFDDPWTGQPSLELAEKNLPEKTYRIAIFHSPIYFDEIAGRYPLCLAGHTHGGQLKFPIIGPLWLPGGCGRYLEGWYERNGSKLYVSRGVGTSVLPIRFLCRPEIPIITLN